MKDQEKKKRGKRKKKKKKREKKRGGMKIKRGSSWSSSGVFVYLVCVKEKAVVIWVWSSGHIAWED